MLDTFGFEEQFVDQYTPTDRKLSAAELINILLDKEELLLEQQQSSSVQTQPVAAASRRCMTFPPR